MENIIFTLAYLLLLLWGIAILASAAITIWNLAGISRELAALKHSTIHIIKRVKLIEWKKVEFPILKRLIHN